MFCPSQAFSTEKSQDFVCFFYFQKKQTCFKKARISKPGCKKAKLATLTFLLVGQCFKSPFSIFHLAHSLSYIEQGQKMFVYLATALFCPLFFRLHFEQYKCSLYLYCMTQTLVACVYTVEQWFPNLFKLRNCYPNEGSDFVLLFSIKILRFSDRKFLLLWSLIISSNIHCDFGSALPIEESHIIPRK